MHFMETDDCHSFSLLTEPGRIVVSAMRSAPSGAAAALSYFVDAFGEKRGQPCFVVFLQIVHSLALFGRRRMRVGTAGWPILTHDEVAFVRCVDAAFRDEETAFDAHVAWLVRLHGAREFGGYVRTLASLMPETLLSMTFADGGPGRREDSDAAAAAMKSPAPRWSASVSPVAID